MDEMGYQGGTASLGLLEWQGRRENRAYLDLKVGRVKFSLNYFQFPSLPHPKKRGKTDD